MLSITIVDSGDRDSMMLRMNVDRALAKTGIKAEVIVVDTARGYFVSGVDRAPALLINGDVIVQGSSMKANDIAAELTARNQSQSTAGSPDKITSGVALPCGGCKHNCDLRTPSCSVGVEKARRLGIR